MLDSLLKPGKIGLKSCGKLCDQWESLCKMRLKVSSGDARFVISLLRMTNGDLKWFPNCGRWFSLASPAIVVSYTVSFILSLELPHKLCSIFSMFILLWRYSLQYMLMFTTFHSCALLSSIVVHWYHTFTFIMICTMCSPKGHYHCLKGLQSDGSLVYSMKNWSSIVLLMKGGHYQHRW